VLSTPVPTRAFPSFPFLLSPQRRIDLFLSYSSAEEAEEELEEGEQRVNNVVHSFRLVETSFDKKSCVFLFSVSLFLHP
jgi:hypothetical protein